MSKRLTLAARQLSSLRSEKTIVLAVLIQLFVAGFSSFMVVGLVSLYNPSPAAAGASISVGVAGNASGDLVPVVAEGDHRNAVVFGETSAGYQAFVSGEVDALLTATRRPDGTVHVEAMAPEGDFRTTFIVVELKDALATYERTRRVELAGRLTRQPVPLPGDVPDNPYFDFIYTVLVPLLAYLPVFISGSVATDSLTEELDRGTLELLRVAPLSLSAIVDGKSLALVLLAPIQAGLWLVLLSANGIPVANPLSILTLVTAAAVLFVVAGAVLALSVRERRAAQLLYSLGVVVAFVAATLLPESPTSAVAKLAIDSPTVVTRMLVVASVAAAMLAYALARLWVNRLSD